MKKVRIADIFGNTWEYYFDEVSWSVGDYYLFVKTAKTKETRLTLRLAIFAYLEVIE